MAIGPVQFDAILIVRKVQIQRIQTRTAHQLLTGLKLIPIEYGSCVLRQGPIDLLI